MCPTLELWASPLQRSPRPPAPVPSLRSAAPRGPPASRPLWARSGGWATPSRPQVGRACILHVTKSVCTLCSNLPCSSCLLTLPAAAYSAGVHGAPQGRFRVAVCALGWSSFVSHFLSALLALAVHRWAPCCCSMGALVCAAFPAAISVSLQQASRHPALPCPCRSGWQQHPLAMSTGPSGAVVASWKAEREPPLGAGPLAGRVSVTMPPSTNRVTATSAASASRVEAAAV